MDSMEEQGQEQEAESNPPPPSLSNLILSLEQATLMAKQLPSTSDPTRLLHIHSSLHQAHHHISAFLSSAAAADNDPMDFGGDEEEENIKGDVDRVEEQMRSCFIKNKRRKKRQLSPSAAEERRGMNGDGDGLVGNVVGGFDPHQTKLRALELVYQFHA